LYAKLRFATLESWSFASNGVPKLELGNEKSPKNNPGEKQKAAIG